MSSMQRDWFLCLNCAVLFHGGFNNDGRCGYQGARHRRGEREFTLSYSGLQTLHRQRDWRYCRRCAALHWAEAALQACPTGGRHDPTGSWNFVLSHSIDSGTTRLSGWRLCTQCAALFWVPGAKQHCCANGCHRGADLDFVLTTLV